MSTLGAGAEVSGGMLPVSFRAAALSVKFEFLELAAEDRSPTDAKVVDNKIPSARIRHSGDLEDRPKCKIIASSLPRTV